LDTEDRVIQLKIMLQVYFETCGSRLACDKHEKQTI